MVVQERVSRSLYLGCFEKRLIEVVGERGLSMEKLEQMNLPEEKIYLSNGDRMGLQKKEDSLTQSHINRKEEEQYEGEEQMDAVMISYARHMRDKIHLRGKKFKMKKEFTQSKGWKYQDEKDNLEMAEFQRKNRSRIQRKTSMKCWKRERCLLLSTHQRCKLLKFIEEKKGRMKMECGMEMIKDVHSLMNAQLASRYIMVKKKLTKLGKCKFKHKQRKQRKNIEEMFLVYWSGKVIQLNGLVKLEGELRPAAIMRKGAKLKCVAREKLLSGNQTLFFRNIKLVWGSFRMNFRGWCKINHCGRVRLKNRKWLKLNDLEKMESERLLATYIRRRVEWKYKMSES